MEDSGLQLVGILLIFGSILYLAYVATRLVGKKSSQAMHSKHMQVVEQISLGLDKRLILVRVGAEHFLFLSGKKEFRQVARIKLDKEDEPEEQEDKASAEPVFDFRQIIDKYIHPRKEGETMKNRVKNTPRDQRKNGRFQSNLRRLEQMQEKGREKEV